MRKQLIASVSALLVLTSTILALNGLVGKSAAVTVDNTPDCDNVSIIKCGAFTESDLRAKFDKNSYGDLKKVYDAFGISKSDLSGFQNGIVWKDGRVTVGDKTVATGAITAGRNFGGTPIPGTKNVGKYSTSKFVTDGQTAFVKMVNGKFSFAIVKTCGNPVTAKPKLEPTYSCDALAVDKINRTDFKFTASATAKNGASIVRYEFNFGDGKTQTSTNKTVSHTYAKPGTYTTKVTVIVSVNGKNVTATDADCAKKVTVETPPVTPPKPQPATYACDELSARLISKADHSYGYSVAYSAKNATLQTADFNFGDGKTQTGVAAANVNKVTHSYATEGSYTTTVTLTFKLIVGGVVGTTTKTATCKVTIDITPEVCAINPSLPKDSPECVETPPVATTPPTIASTGPTDIIGGAFGLSSIAGAGYYLQTSRRHLLSKLLNR